MTASPLLLRLDSLISKCNNQLEADCLRAEKAAYLARVQTNDDAAEIIRQLHARYDRSPNILISIWLNLAEGLLTYFRALDTGARDKLRRSFALAKAAGNRRLQAVSGAWLAQIDYMCHDVDEMALHLKHCFDNSDATHHGARSRACLVAVQALHHAGEYDLAAKWNKCARLHAVEDGDEATLSALMHNLAWLWMVTWREHVLTGRGDPQQGRHALIISESTQKFDELVRAETLAELHPLLRAQVLSLKDQPEEALAIYQSSATDGHATGLTRLDGTVLADKAWCHLRLTNTEEARRYASLAGSSLTPQTHIDDVAATHSRLALIYAALGEPEQQAREAQLADLAWSENDKLQARVRKLIGGLVPG